MRRFWLLILLLSSVLAAAMALTAATGLGYPLWHYNVGFLATLAVAAAAWPWLRTRRVTTLAMAFTGVPATLTGFVMLYTIQFPYKEWLTWWHCVTSFALVLAFLVHWLHNRTRLAQFTARLATRDRLAGLPAAAAWALLLGAALWTWLPQGRAPFTGERYVLLASWSILAAIALAYAPWLATRAPPLRAWLQGRRARDGARALVDTGLWLSHWLAILTGFALVYLAEPLRAGDLKYVSKWWHTATSALFLAFVALHAGFNARLLAAHARRVDDELRPGSLPR